MTQSSSKSKTSVRIALTPSLVSALDYLKTNHFPFMKDDEVFKMALSKLYAETVSHAEVITLFYKIRESNPKFGQSYLEDRNFQVKNLTIKDISNMFAEDSKSKIS